MPVSIDARRYDGVLFDLDGVVTDTAAVHAKTWRALFDDVLSRRPQRTGEDHSPFVAADYLHYIDGKPADTIEVNTKSGAPCVVVLAPPAAEKP